MCSLAAVDVYPPPMIGSECGPGRFPVQPDGMMVDRKTGLKWALQVAPRGRVECRDQNRGNNCRLPDANELRTIMSLPGTCIAGTPAANFPRSTYWAAGGAGCGGPSGPGIDDSYFNACTYQNAFDPSTMNEFKSYATSDPVQYICATVCK